MGFGRSRITDFSYDAASPGVTLEQQFSTFGDTLLTKASIPTLPSPLHDLYATIHAEIAKLPGVAAGARSFRIGQKIFVRFARQRNRTFLEFKLPSADASRALQHPFVQPMQFGGMGRHGWVEVAVTRKSQLPIVLKLVRVSHGLYWKL